MAEKQKLIQNYLGMLLLSGAITLAQQPEGAKNLNQLVLNRLAMPLAPTSFTPPLPPTHAAWSADQRADGPRQIAGQCRAVWGMMNDHSKIQLLPQNQDAADTPRLVMEVCALGKMPHDWPGRAQLLSEVQRILGRSSESGEPLTLPASIPR